MTDNKLPTVAKVPCVSCPYRCDVASGIWHTSEYMKLVGYEGEIIDQLNSPNLFLCHQKDGNLCAGWVACHGVDNLLALRLRPVDPAVYDYVSPVPVFKSGAEAMEHGIAEISRPGKKAKHLIDTIDRKRRKKSNPPTGS